MKITHVSKADKAKNKDSVTQKTYKHKLRFTINPPINYDSADETFIKRNKQYKITDKSSQTVQHPLKLLLRERINPLIIP